MSARPALGLSVLPNELAIARLAANADVPTWALQQHAPLISITRTEHELSIVAPAALIPASVAREGPWRALAVHGPLDFSEVGILAALAAALADAGVSLFAISTYDTDLLLVRSERLADAVAALSAAGHRVVA